MHFTIVTLFPEAFSSFVQTSLFARALAKGLVRLRFVNPRDFTSDKHRTVDDTPYGGGRGMVLRPDPVVSAIEAAAEWPDDATKAVRILLTPQGETLTQPIFREFARQSHLVLVCGRYEGFDERIRGFVDREVSLGDFVLNGGEVAAMALLDGVSRLIPGFVGHEQSVARDSFEDGLLEHPQYTRPALFRGLSVPEVLVNGNHKEIDTWREAQRHERTRTRRPDLWASFQGKNRATGTSGARLYLALVHYPVRNRLGEVVTTAITNLDLHDIARTAHTYGACAFFVTTPIESQRQLAEDILKHWGEDGYGALTQPDRSEALAMVRVEAQLCEAIAEIERKEACRPIVVATTATAGTGRLGFSSARTLLASEKPVLLVLGTGSGLASGVIESADYVLAPIEGRGAYNHLSVRSAVAIILDRLLGICDASGASE